MKHEKFWKFFYGAVLVAVWGTLIYVFIKSNGNLTAEQLVSYCPESPLIAVLAMLGLFLLKSVDFIMYSGILFAANGIMFPLLPALCLNLVGMCIMLTIPYFAGAKLGTKWLERLREKHPKLKEADSQLHHGETVAALFMRLIGIPLHVASIYMGAAGFDYGKFLLGSMIGLLPEMVSMTVIGMSATDVSSPVFVIALLIKVFLMLIPVVIHLRKRKSDQ